MYFRYWDNRPTVMTILTDDELRERARTRMEEAGDTLRGLERQGVADHSDLSKALRGAGYEHLVPRLLEHYGERPERVWKFGSG